MAQPLLPNSRTFESDQKINFRAFYWDTTTTAVRLGPSQGANQYKAFGTGLEFALFSLRDTSFNPTSAADYEAAMGDSARTLSSLGYDTGGNYRTGVIPNIYSYWGAGAPVGASTAKQVILKYSGYVQGATGPVTLVFAGQGHIHVVHTPVSTGVPVVLVSGDVREPIPHASTEGVTASVIKNDWGYQFTAAVTFAAGDKLDIYYHQNGEPWGGIAAKIIPGAATTNSDAFLTELREAPVLGVSFMAKESTSLPETEIPYITDMSAKQAVGAVAEMVIKVALTTAGSGDGFRVATVNGEDVLIDNANALTVLKKGRLIHFEGGFRTPTGADELYPRFTGYIEDIFPEAGGDEAVIQCRTFDGRLADVFDENNPDRLAYHAAGYILREQSAEPVFGIPAYDNWSVEVILADLFARAGIDHYNLGKTAGGSVGNHGRARFSDASTNTTFYGNPLVFVRALATPTRHIQLERNTNYGNVPPLEKDYLPKDDEYLFKPQVTQRLYDRIRGVADHLGYDFFFNAEGQCVFSGRNNPTYFQYATKPGMYATPVDGQDQQIAVNAVGGTYMRRKHSAGAWSRVITGHFSRADLYVGTGRASDDLNGGNLQALVERWTGSGWVTVQTITASTWADNDESFYYDSVITATGANAAVITVASLPFDHYRITISGAGPDKGETDCHYRLNGVALYERNPDQSYYTQGRNAQVFSTLKNTLKISPESNFKDLRNHVVVVGGRRAIITDSAKLATEQQSVNNQEREFYVAVAVDPFSIYDPTSPNFVGMKRMTVVFDDKVTDTDFARWLTRTLLYRYRMPKTSAKFTHTAIPTIELRDAMDVVEERNLSVNHRLWVTSFTEHWTPEEATTDVDAVANPEIPSYQPREDIDIDSYFVDPADNKGEPVIDLSISYKNIYGRQVGNSTLHNADAIKGLVTRNLGSSQPMYSQQVLSGASLALTKPAIPETIYLAWGVNGTTHTQPSGLKDNEFSAKGEQRLYRRALINGPYRRFWNTSWSAGLPTLAFDFQEGDGSVGVYDKGYYGFPSSGSLLWYVLYDYLRVRTDNLTTDAGTPLENPWYDPYTSELGNLVDIDFTLLVNGRVRASVWAYSEALGAEVPVAWLTAPTSEPEQPEAHWVYMDSGSQTFSFDGVDNIGYWNTLQSLEYAESMKGAFGDKPMAVGRGFYAWNDKATNLHTLIGDNNTWAAKKPNFDKQGEPYYTIGQFGQFFIKIEVANDTLLRKDYVNGKTQPRVVDSRTLPTALSMNAYNQVFIWQHLGEPTQVAIRMQDWKNVDATTGALTKAWVPGTATTETDWTDFSNPDEGNTGVSTDYQTEAEVRVGKPVRITFVPRAHRGPMWEDANGDLNPALTSAKLTRQVHHKGTIFDQFWTLYGKPWDGFHTDWASLVSGVEKKRLANRMFHNEDHTLEFEDTNWRTGDQIAAMEWIFDPSQFKKDFGFGITEALRYADYEQLESLPGFDARHLGGTATGERAYMLMAYLNHIFYFSAFAIDRSGRRQHCLDSWTDENGHKRGWIDKTKIVTPTWRSASSDPTNVNYKPEYIVDYERRGADHYLVRTMFARQWREPGWAAGTYPGNPVSKYAITNATQKRLVQAKSTDFDPYLIASSYPESHPLADASFTVDPWLTEMQRPGSATSKATRWKAPNRDTAIIETFSTGMKFCPPSLGTWQWDRPGVAGFFLPNPGRDFHPYARFPMSPDLAVVSPDVWLTSEDANAYNALEATGSSIAFSARDISAQQQWHGYSYSLAYAGNWVATHASAPITSRNKFYGPRIERTVEELGAIGPSEVTDGYGMDAARVAAAFDYSKMDNLDRWDQFRGLIARGPYGERDNWASENYYDKNNKRRAANPQPVKPSGVYLFSVGKLNDYIIAPVHDSVDLRCHWTSQGHSFWDIKFWHQYTWYSPTYFPISREGAPLYGFFKDEFTGASTWVGRPWLTYIVNGIPTVSVWGMTLQMGSASAPNHYGMLMNILKGSDKEIFYDAGAWTGWRPDGPDTITNLKWSEVKPVMKEALTTTKNERWTLHGDASTNDNTAFLYAGASLLNHKVRANILDEYGAKPMAPRLAVSWPLAEQRTVVMNLSLPERLSGT